MNREQFESLRESGYLRSVFPDYKEGCELNYQKAGNQYRNCDDRLWELTFQDNNLIDLSGCGFITDKEWFDIVDRERIKSFMAAKPSIEEDAEDACNGLFYENYGRYQEPCRATFSITGTPGNVFCVMDNNPPLRPRHEVDKLRQQEILEAMTRYVEAGKKVPQEWILEFEDINNTLGE